MAAGSMLLAATAKPHDCLASRSAWILISVYVLCALMATVAGIVLSGYVGYVDRYLGRGFDSGLNHRSRDRRHCVHGRTRDIDGDDGRRFVGAVSQQHAADLGIGYRGAIACERHRRHCRCRPLFELFAAKAKRNIPIISRCWRIVHARVCSVIRIL